MAWEVTDASTDKVDLTPSNSVNSFPDSDWTQSIWAKHSSGDVVDGTYQNIWAGEGAGGYDYFGIRVNTSEQIDVMYSYNVTYEVYTAESGNSFNNTNWHHILARRSGTSFSLRVDDTEVITGTLTNPITIDDFVGFGDVDWTPFNGYLAEAGKWDRALSDDECTALSKGFAPSCFPRDMVLYIPMIREYVDVVSGQTLTNSGTSAAEHPPIIYPSGPFVVIAGTAGQTITAPLDSATGLYTPASMDLTLDVTAPLESATGILTNTFTLTFTLNGITQTATLYAPASINEGLSIGGVLQNATGIYVPSIPWDQNVTAPVITASGQVVAAVQWDQQVAGALLQATGTLDTGVWVIDQNIAGQILSATGILDTQAWSIDSNIAGVYITPTGLIAATFTGEQLYTGDFTFETPDSDSFTIETPGSDSFTEE